MTDIVLHSQLDKSINHIVPAIDGGYYESRFVQRTDDTAIIYLSAASGCDKACRFCHLTQTGQLQKEQATAQNLFNQIDRSLADAVEKYDLTGLKNLHFNFMARGDILSNGRFTFEWDAIIRAMHRKALAFRPDVTPRFKLSTIFPNDMEMDDLVRQFIRPLYKLRKEGIDVEVYYSLYSLNHRFRKRWLPKAMSPDTVAELFRGKEDGLRLHYALIAGQNDSEEDIVLIHDWLKYHDLHVQMNIVRYNPYDASCGAESSEEVIHAYKKAMELSHRVDLVQIIPRVGKDVAASCGTFYSERI